MSGEDVPRWPSIFGPTPDTTPEPTPDEPEPTPGTEAGTNPEELIPLRAAAELAGVSVGALRKRYQAGDLERHYADDGRVLLETEAVRRLYGIAGASQTTATPAAAPAPEAETPPGSVLVPLAAWEKTLEQLGNLHQAGQELAAARELVGRLEEREHFAQERRRLAEERTAALEAELAELRKGETKPDADRRRWWQR